MANPRVHEVAADLGIDSKIALDKLKDMGEFVKKARASVERFRIRARGENNKVSLALPNGSREGKHDDLALAPTPRAQRSVNRRTVCAPLLSGFRALSRMLNNGADRRCA